MTYFFGLCVVFYLFNRAYYDEYPELGRLRCVEI